MEFSSSEFADFIGVSKRQVNNYRNDGMPSIQKGKYHYYNFESVQWLFNSVTTHKKTLELNIFLTPIYILICTKIKKVLRVVAVVYGS